MTATSASQSTESSWAFFSRPWRLLENVTCLLFEFSIFFISIFPRPIFSLPNPTKIIDSRSQKSNSSSISLAQQFIYACRFIKGYVLTKKGKEKELLYKVKKRDKGEEYRETHSIYIAPNGTETTSFCMAIVYTEYDSFPDPLLPH